MAKRKPKEPTPPDVDTYVKEYKKFLKDLETYVIKETLYLEGCKAHLKDFMEDNNIKEDEE